MNNNNNTTTKDTVRFEIQKAYNGVFVGSLQYMDAMREFATVDEFFKLCERYRLSVEVKSQEPTA